MKSEVFNKGAEYYFTGQVKITSARETENKTVIWFKVKEYDVRLELSRTTTLALDKNFTCTCKAGSIPSKQVITGRAWPLCSHIVAAIIYLGMKQYWRKKRWQTTLNARIVEATKSRKNSGTKQYTDATPAEQ
ncbi:hypothetical protein D6783_03195 [Candidatus Woesearchaeota archaeon]|nr:MAG: hypothetical protein D6783_03195 [Candidatus Woesearchaeota archaeon]